MGFPYYLPVFAKIFTCLHLLEIKLIRKPSFPYEIHHGLWDLKFFYFQRNLGLPKIKTVKYLSDLYIYLYLADVYGILLSKYISFMDPIKWRLY